MGPTPSLAFVGRVRADGSPRRDVDRDVTYCAEGWQVGGFAFGATLGVRLLIE